MAQAESATELPPALVEDIQKGNCVVFVGAGFTVPAGLPDWNKLLLTLISESSQLNNNEYLRKLIGWDGNGKWIEGASPSIDDYDQCAQIIEDRIGADQMLQKVKEQLQAAEQSNTTPEMTRRLQLLRGIPFRGILTTNYDLLLPGPPARSPDSKPLMRRILRDPKPDWAELVDQTCSRSTRAPPCIQLHGSIAELDHGLALSRLGYRSLLQDEIYKGFLSSVMAGKTILYIGFSFTDGYINDLRRSIVAMLGEFRPDDQPVAYAICNDMTTEQQDFYRQHEGVHVMSYCTHNDDGTRDFSGFEKILGGIYRATNPLYQFLSRVQNKRILWIQCQQWGDAARMAARMEEEIRNPLLGLEWDGPFITVHPGDRDTSNQVQGKFDSVSQLLGALPDEMAQTRYDLVITNFTFDGNGNGEAIAVPLLEQLNGSVPVIVFASQMNAEERKQQLMGAGARAYVNDPGQLFAQIQEVLAPAKYTISRHSM